MPTLCVLSFGNSVCLLVLVEPRTPSAFCLVFVCVGKLDFDKYLWINLGGERIGHVIAD